jgi:cytoskeletal protein CcmA (bactofilin family)
MVEVEMSKHLISVVTITLMIPFMLLIAAVPVMAADLRSEGTVVVASEEVVDDDLYIGGNEIIIDGTVNGDLWAAGRTITINGTVTGSIVVAGQTITINGEIARAARIAGSELSINGTVGGDLLAFGSNIFINNSARIGGDLICGGQNIRINGTVDGNIRGGAATATIYGTVEGNVELDVETLTIASTARINGNLTYTGEKEAKVDSGASIQGSTIHNIPEKKKEHGIAGKIWGKVLGFLMVLLIGIIVIVIAPRKTISTADAIRHRPLPSLGWGAVLLFATPVAAIVVCFTVIGLPIGLITLALWGIALYLCQIPVALFLGRLIIRRATETEAKGLQIGALAVGLVILVVLRIVPYLGFVIWLATSLFGLGSLAALVQKQPESETA